MLAAYSIGRSSIEKIAVGEKSVYSTVAIVFLGVSIIIKLWLFVFYKRIAKHIDSTVLRASAADSISDVIATSVILISIVISAITGAETDGYIGILVSLFIVYSGVKIVHESMDRILGVQVDETIEKSLRNVALEHYGVSGVHDIMVHNYGNGRCFASLHAEVSGDTDIYVAHDIADDIENSISKKYDIKCVVHIDPLEKPNSKYDNVKTEIERYVVSIGNGISIHDFRIVPGSLHVKFVFDVSVPYEVKASDSEIVSSINDMITKYKDEYIVSVTIDRY